MIYMDKHGTRITTPFPPHDMVVQLPDDELSQQVERMANALTELENLRRVADAAETQAKLALEQANKANDTSLIARIKANKAFILSVIALLVTLLINADKIVTNVQKILSYLGRLGH